MIHYTVKANKPFVLAGVLINNRIPFEFNPTQKFGKKKWKNGYGSSVFEIDLLLDGEGSGGEEISLADLLYQISQRPNGKGFELTILSKHEY